MKVYGDSSPETAFAVRGDTMNVRLYENVKAEGSGYVYDEYTLALPNRPGLTEDISANLGGYLAAARAEEKMRLARECPKGAAEAEEDRTETEQSVTDLYLDVIEAQQDITDLQLQILEE